MSTVIATISLAVARTSPSGLISMALKGEPWAGMILMFPVLISTIWTCPGVRPGKATILDPRQHRPRGLLAVSNTDSFSGGEEKAQRCTLLCKATTILERDRQTRFTGERNSSVITACCFASSQIITYFSLSIHVLCPSFLRSLPTLFWGNFGRFPPPTKAM